jgi:predicted RNA-binding Zn-ribbon protein involved in translation (DUF1610 family)
MMVTPEDLPKPEKPDRFESGSKLPECRRLPGRSGPVGRRGIKEYRAAEALTLIATDRDHKPLVCPSCGSTEIERTPRRLPRGAPDLGRITLHCSSCGRSAVYLAVTNPGGQPQTEGSKE